MSFVFLISKFKGALVSDLSVFEVTEALNLA